jgi:hypothetical protein
MKLRVSDSSALLSSSIHLSRGGAHTLRSPASRRATDGRVFTEFGRELLPLTRPAPRSKFNSTVSAWSSRMCASANTRAGIFLKKS